MPKKDFTIDYSVFEKRAKALARKLGKDEKEFIKQQTGILAREVAKFTPPFASFPNHKGSAIGKKADETQGKWAVYMDIKWICTIKPADEIAKARRSWGSSPIIYGGKTITKGVIDDVGSLKAWHNANQGLNNRTKPLKGPMRYWVSDTVFTAYVKEEQKKVGIAKAAFAKASVALGAKGAVPAWVRKHMGTVSGSGVLIKESKGTKGIIAGQAGGLFHTNKHVPSLMKNRLVKAVKRGEFLMKKAAKDSNFKVV
tara:strand:+ start:25 stop:789 length:765 start_codon:yes stop_codon:yes gene_type:complete